MEIVELERERRHLQRELAVASKGYRDVTFGAETASQLRPYWRFGVFLLSICLSRSYLYN